MVPHIIKRCHLISAVQETKSVYLGLGLGTSWPVGAERAMTPPEFGKSVKPISTREADYAQKITTPPPPRFLDPPNALQGTELVQGTQTILPKVR